MGCCFSKEVDNSKNEKLSLLPNTVEEEASEDRISKTLTSILETMERQEVPTVQKALAVSNNCMESVKYPPHCMRTSKKDHVPMNIHDRRFNLNSFLDMERQDSLQERERIKDALGWERLTENSNSCTQWVTNAGAYCNNSNSENGSVVSRKLQHSFENASTSCVPVASGQDFLEDSSFTKISSVAGKCSLLQDESEAVEDHCSPIVSNRADGDTAPSAFAYLDIGRHHLNTKEEFYSMCVVDDGDLNIRVEGLEETSLDVKNSFAEEVYSMSWPLGNGGEMLVEKSVQMAGELNAPKDASYCITEDLVVPETEMEIDASIDVINGGYRLNTGSLEADVLRAQEPPQNRAQEMGTLASNICVKDSISESSNSSTPLCLAQSRPCSPQVKRASHVGIPTFDYATSCGIEMLLFNENPNTEQKENHSKQLLSNLKFSSELDKATTDFLCVSQGCAEHLIQSKRGKSESRQNATENANEFGTRACGDKEAPSSFEQCKDTDPLLKYENIIPHESLCKQKNVSDDAIEIFLTSDVLPFEAEVANIPESSRNKPGNCGRATEPNLSQIDHKSLETIGLRGASRGSKDSLPFPEPLNINSHEGIQMDNHLEVQLPHELSKTNSEMHKYDSLPNKCNSCPVSLSHFEASELDLNDEQGSVWDKCKSCILEDELPSTGADHCMLRAHVEGTVDPLNHGTSRKGRMHRKPATQLESQNSFTCASEMLKSSCSLIQKHSVVPNVQESHEVLGSLNTSEVNRIAVGQLEIETFSVSGQENDMEGINGESGLSKTSARLFGKISELDENCSLPGTPKQSETEAAYPGMSLVSEISATNAAILKENTKHASPESSLHKLKSEMEIACKADPLKNHICSLKTNEVLKGIWVDPRQVDKYAATPSYEIPLGDREFEQGSAKCFLDLMEDILKESENTPKMEAGDPQAMNDITNRFCQPVPLSQLFLGAGFIDEQEYLMEYLWINSPFSNSDNKSPTGEMLQKEGGGLTVPLFGVGAYPYHLLVQPHSRIWEWQDRDEEFVSIL